MLGLFLSLSGVGQWHITWNFLPKYPRFTIFSMSPSSGNASVFQKKVIDIEKLQLEPDLVYPEYPIKIVDHKTRVTRNQTSDFYKVQWSNHSEREAT